MKKVKIAALTALVGAPVVASAGIGADIAAESADMLTEIALLAPAAAAVVGAILVITVVLKGAKRVFS